MAAPALETVAVPLAAGDGETASTVVEHPHRSYLAPCGGGCCRCQLCWCICGNAASQVEATAGPPLVAADTGVEIAAPALAVASINAQAHAIAARQERRIQPPFLAQFWCAVRAETHGSIARHFALIKLHDESWTRLSTVALPCSE